MWVYECGFGECIKEWGVMTENPADMIDFRWFLVYLQHETESKTYWYRDW